MNKNVSDIGKEYVQFISEETRNIEPDILLYGSTVYGKITSDLDITFLVKDISYEDYKQIETLTIDFQKQNHMCLDNEVPYSSKLVYTKRDVEDMLNNTPFKKENGIYQITPIEKTKAFLCSKEMKYRLLLNILTTRFMLLQGNEHRINTYRQKAWDLLVKVIMSYNKLSEIDLDHFIKLLYKDEKTQKEGEMFLGYKTNIKQKQIDLEEDCEETLNRMAKDGQLKKLSTRKFTIVDDLER